MFSPPVFPMSDMLSTLGEPGSSPLFHSTYYYRLEKYF